MGTETVCEDFGGGSPGGEVPVVNENNLADHIPNKSSIPVSKISEVRDPNNRRVLYRWTFAKSKTETFDSIEEGLHKKVSGVWEWHSLSHANMLKNGTSWFIESEMNVANVDYVLGKYAAGVELHWQYTGKFLSSWGPVVSNTSDKSTSEVWDSRN